MEPTFISASISANICAMSSDWFVFRHIYLPEDSLLRFVYCLDGFLVMVFVLVFSKIARSIIDLAICLKVFWKFKSLV